MAATISQTPQSYAENVLLHLLVSPALENMNKSLFDYSGHVLTPSPILTAHYRDKVIKIADELLVKASKNTKFNSFLNKGLKAVDKLTEDIEGNIKEATKPSLQGQTMGMMLKGGF